MPLLPTWGFFFCLCYVVHFNLNSPFVPARDRSNTKSEIKRSFCIFDGQALDSMGIDHSGPYSSWRSAIAWPIPCMPAMSWGNNVLTWFQHASHYILTASWRASLSNLLFRLMISRFSPPFSCCRNEISPYYSRPIWHKMPVFAVVQFDCCPAIFSKSEEGFSCLTDQTDTFHKNQGNIVTTLYNRNGDLREVSSWPTDYQSSFLFQGESF